MTEGTTKDKIIFYSYTCDYHDIGINFEPFNLFNITFSSDCVKNCGNSLTAVKLRGPVLYINIVTVFLKNRESKELNVIFVFFFFSNKLKTVNSCWTKRLKCVHLYFFSNNN